MFFFTIFLYVSSFFLFRGAHIFFLVLVSNNRVCLCFYNFGWLRSMADVCLLCIIFSVLLFTEGAAPCTDCTSFFLCRKLVQFLYTENLYGLHTFFFVHLRFVFLYKKIRLEKSVQSAYFGHVQVLGFTFLGSNLCSLP